MVKIKIFDKGFLIRVNKKDIRTPTEIICHETDVNGIVLQLAQMGMHQYSIISKIANVQADVVENNIEESIVEPVTIFKVPKGYNLNYMRDNYDPRDHSFQLDRNLSRELAEVVDYTNSMSPVKDQGTLGSCVGFAVTAMKEWQEQQEHLREVSEGKVYKRKAANYDLSEQWLYYKSKEIDSWPNEEGTSIRYAMKILSSVGVPIESAWPYNESLKGDPKRWAKMVAKWALGGEYLRLSTPETIMNALKDNGPVPVGIGCYQEIFYTGADGVVAYPKDPNTCYGGHAICLVGWNPQTRMFKFKNSWGTGWGQSGYGYLPYNYIKDFCWDAWMMKDLSVTRDMLKDQPA